MGNSQAKRAETLTDVPWRILSKWDGTVEMSITEDINRMQRDVKPNILMLGPVGAGKSSYITAVLSIGKKTRYGGALTGETTSSYTLKFKRHTDETLLHGFNLYDCMGIESDEGYGLHTDDIVFLLQGHMKNNYKLKSNSPLQTTDEYYVADPQVKDRMHCVVFVLNATTLHSLSQAVIMKIKDFQEKIRKEEIPRVVVLTKCDILCEEVRKSQANLFSSVKVQKAVKLASEIFTIEMASIHPVVNYEADADIRSEINICLLLAVRQMASYAVDTLDMLSDDRCVRPKERNGRNQSPYSSLQR